jgi:hypothetical protein
MELRTRPFFEIRVGFYAVKINFRNPVLKCQLGLFVCPAEGFSATFKVAK